LVYDLQAHTVSPSKTRRAKRKKHASVTKTFGTEEAELWRRTIRSNAALLKHLEAPYLPASYPPVLAMVC